MRSLKSALLAAVAVAAALAVRPTRAEDEEPEEPIATGAEAKALRAVDDLATAARMVELGRRTENAEALIAAALAFHGTPTDVGEDKPDSTPSGDEAAALLDEAAKLRPQDKALQASVAAAQERLKDKERGATTGAKSYGPFRIAVGKHDDTARKFAGRCKVTVRLTGTSPAWKPKGLYLIDPPFATVAVIDSKGKVVASNGGYNLSTPVTWNAGPKAASYTIRVTNVSPAGIGQPKGVAILCTLTHN